MAKVVENAISRAQKSFINEPLTDFTQEAPRHAQTEALEQVRSELGRTYPLIIGGKKITGDHT